MCRQGASVIQSNVLDTIKEPNLRVYVAWVPILPEDTETPDAGTRALLPDRRAVHFWDAEHALPEPFSRMLRLPEGWPAWDIYLAYPPGVDWEGEPPAPAFWHHQLGDTLDAPMLDGPRFAKQLRALLKEHAQL